MIFFIVYLVIGLILAIIAKNIEIEWDNKFFAKITQNNFIFFPTCTILWLPLVIKIMLSNPSIEI